MSPPETGAVPRAMSSYGGVLLSVTRIPDAMGECMGSGPLPTGGVRTLCDAPSTMHRKLRIVERRQNHDSLVHLSVLRRSQHRPPTPSHATPATGAHASLPPQRAGSPGQCGLRHTRKAIRGSPTGGQILQESTSWRHGRSGENGTGVNVCGMELCRSVGTLTLRIRPRFREEPSQPPPHGSALSPIFECVPND